MLLIVATRKYLVWTPTNLILGDPAAVSWGEGKSTLWEKNRGRKVGAKARSPWGKSDQVSSKQLSECCLLIGEKNSFAFLLCYSAQSAKSNFESLSCDLTWRLPFFQFNLHQSRRKPEIHFGCQKERNFKIHQENFRLDPIRVVAKNHKTASPSVFFYSRLTI